MFRLFAFLTFIFMASGAAATQLYVDAPKDGFLNLRSGPSTAYHVIGKMPHGSKLQVLAAPGKWYKVRHISGQVGWASSRFMSATKTQPHKPKPGHDYGHGGGLNLDRYFVHAPAHGALNLRRGPGTGYDVIQKMKQGSPVEVLGNNGTWWLVRHKSGNVGWAHSDYLTRKRHQLNNHNNGPRLNGYVDAHTWNKIVNHCTYAPNPQRCLRRELRRITGFVPHHGTHGGGFDHHNL